jgi:hypothetical protein
MDESFAATLATVAAGRAAAVAESPIGTRPAAPLRRLSRSDVPLRSVIYGSGPSEDAAAFAAFAADIR